MTRGPLKQGREAELEGVEVFGLGAHCESSQGFN